MRYLMIVILLVSLRVNAQELPKKVKMNTVPVPELNLMIDQYETSVGDWLGFIESKRLAYVEEGLTEEEALLKIEPYFYFIEHMDMERHALLKTYKNYLFNWEDTGEEGDHTYIVDGYQTFRFYVSHADIILNFDFSDALVNNITARGKTVDDSLEVIMWLPVTGVPLEQIREYAEWKARSLENDKKLKNAYKFKGRLMTPEEYTRLLKIGGPKIKENNTSELPDTTNEQGCYLMNIKYNTPCKSTKEQLELYGRGTVPAYSYWADAHGLLNIFGNVAEMTSEPGIAKGGSFRDYGAHSMPEKVKKYEFTTNKVMDWVGFRVVYEMVE